MRSVYQIINKFHTSNTYIIEISNKEVLLIDVGNPDEILDWLFKNKKKVHSVILTHEHSDHCHGVNELYKQYNFELYCSKLCAKNIGNSRQNFSRYIEELETFEINVATTNIISDMQTLKVLEKEVFFYETPGHSPGSICILIEDMLFTGDTILNNIKTPLNLPHSNRSDYKRSIKKLEENLGKNITIFPGHGESFELTSFEDLIING